MSRREQCRLCGGSSLQLVVPLPPTAVADAYVGRDELDQIQPTYPLDLYFCERCAHVQLLDVVDPRLMFRPDYTYRSAGSAGIVRHFQEYARDLIGREGPAPGSLVIDVGSNDGTFLRPFKEAGLSVLGIDPATDLARAATAEAIYTIPSFLTVELARTIRSERGPARLVTANNVFAHADDLAGMATSIRALLGPDGLFAFEVSYVVDVVEQMLLGTIFHEHLCYHAVRPLQGFLARHDLEIVDVQRVGIQGGSIIVYAQPTGGPRTVSPRVAEMIHEEEERGFLGPETYRQFHGRIERLKSELGQVTRELGAEAAGLAGYGAARGGTTILYALGIGEQIRFIVDDSPAKQGQYSPGHHIPILPSESLYQSRPSAVLILAWVHALAIVRSQQQYLADGGRFILTHPHLQVVSAAWPPQE